MNEDQIGNVSGPSAPELRLVLLGNIGCGKTATGDTILGQLSPASPSDASRSCQIRQGSSERRRVTLVEAPRWYWSREHVEERVRKETERALALTSPGPHAFLLLVPVGQFINQVEGRMPAALEEVFGEGVLDHTLVLLTCGDYLVFRTAQAYLQQEDPGLRQVIERCGGRYHVLNNRQRHDREQVRHLLEKIEDMGKKNGGYYRYLKTSQQRKREIEEQVINGGENELREAQHDRGRMVQEKNETVASRCDANTDRRTDEGVREGRDGSTTSLEQRRREEEEEEEVQETMSSVGAGLLSATAAPETKPQQSQHDSLLSAIAPESKPQQSQHDSLLSTTAVPETKPQQSQHDSLLSATAAPESKPQQSQHDSLHSATAAPESKPQQSQHDSLLSATAVPESKSHQSQHDSLHSDTAVPESKPQQSERDSVFSAIAPESKSQQSQHDGMTQVKRSSSFSMNTDGALLSQLSEVKPTEKMITTFHHRINSLEERSSPEASPTTTSSSTLASSPPSSSSSSTPEVRLILLGRSGSGKSAAGNLILGREAFASQADSLTAITLHCGKKRALVAGRMVSVVDTPDWFQSERAPDEVRAQISSCVALSAPGPHAFLLCVPVDQPARTELQALRVLEAVFGPEAVRSHTVVLFTHADRLRGSGKAAGGVEEYIAAQRGDLLKLVEKCMDRFHVMERGRGGEGETTRNVAELLEKVEQTVREAGGGFYSSPAFQEAEDKVRQRQVEMARERKRGWTEGGERVEDGTKRLSSPQQPLTEAEGEDEIEGTRDEAERSVSAGTSLESLPEISLSALSPSLLRSVWEKVESGARMVPRLLADSSVWEKCQGQEVPRSMADASTRVGYSGAKTEAGSPLWEKVGSGARSGARMVADGSMRVGAGIGTGAKNLAQSPVWGKVGAGAKTGAKMVADGSMQVGAGIGAVAQSPVWGKVGSGGAKIVTESSIWDKVRSGTKRIPVVVLGALLGLMLGVFFGGLFGGAAGATTGAVVTEVGRRKYGTNTQTQTYDEASNHVHEGMESRITKSGEKQLKTE